MVSAPVPAPAPAAKPKVEPIQSLNWELGRKKPLSVDEAIKQAIQRNSVRTEPKAPDKPKTSFAAPTIKSGQSLHSHQCGRCGYVFSHTSASFGNAQEHMCPKCGFGPNWRVLQ